MTTEQFALFTRVLAQLERNDPLLKIDDLRGVLLVLMENNSV